VAGDAPQSARKRNRLLIVDELRQRRVATRGELAQATGLSRATIAALVRDLEARGLVVEQSNGNGAAARGPRGRPALPLRLGTPAGVAIGVDFGHDCLRIAVADLSSTVLAERFVSLDVDHHPDVALTAAANAIDELLEQTGFSRSQVIGVGVGVPAPVDGRTGVVGSSPIVAAWAGLDIRREAAQRFGVHVEVDNDANLEALAEASAGEGRGKSDLVYVKLSSGIGAGLVLAGELCRGSAGFAGEIGHIQVRPDGPVCRCGNRGCLETVASTGALLLLLRPIYGDDLTLEALLQLSRDGDDAAVRVIHDAGRAVGRVLADICNTINPGLIVVGGDLSRAGEPLVFGIREAVDRYALPAAATSVVVTQGALGDRAALMGALTLAISDTERLPSARLPALQA
jgi:predicted NBD/HSP70 family sugar kinase/biotin operon repressor